jgi:glycosyltransferase involved in cell wall biosynthesis
MNKAPLFSICTEVTNRENTIERTMQAIAEQSFSDYEYVIVNNKSDDNSHEIITTFLENNYELSKKTRYVHLSERLPDISAWNRPLKFCKGKYIVVCEGDDWFDSNHLAVAAEVLNLNKDLGLYVSMTKGDFSRKNEYLTPSDQCLESLILFEFVPPPSNAIFLREWNLIPFKYDNVNAVYAGEYSLYYELFKTGLDGYVNTNAQTVNRGVSHYQRGYFHIRDAYYYFNKWKEEYSDDQQIFEIREKLFVRVVTLFFFPQLLRFRVEKKMVDHLYSEMIAMGVSKSTFLFVKLFFSRAMGQQIRLLISGLIRRIAAFLGISGNK